MYQLEIGWVISFFPFPLYEHLPFSLVDWPKLKFPYLQIKDLDIIGLKCDHKLVSPAFATHSQNPTSPLLKPTRHRSYIFRRSKRSRQRSRKPPEFEVITVNTFAVVGNSTELRTEVKTRNLASSSTGESRHHRRTQSSPDSRRRFTMFRYTSFIRFNLL
ncbi:hypothetical protein Hanom_Chr10g00913291 [Helianthus anomalus]